MATATSYPNAPDLSADDYIVIGLATCFIKEEGEVHQVQIVEPIPSAALRRSKAFLPYQLACATTLGAVLAGETPQRPAGFPESAQFGDEFVQRVLAAARTYKRREVAKSHSQGTTRDDFKYSTERGC